MFMRQGHTIRYPDIPPPKPPATGKGRACRAGEGNEALACVASYFSVITPCLAARHPSRSGHMLTPPPFFTVRGCNTAYAQRRRRARCRDQIVRGLGRKHAAVAGSAMSVGHAQGEQVD